MKAYLITMFILWIMRASLVMFEDSITISHELKPIRNLLRWLIAIGFACWTGVLLFT